MVALTVLSIVVSGVLAYLAYRNGSTATRIAHEAAVREEHYREREAERLAKNDRDQVALAMLRALAAVDRAVQNVGPKWQTTQADAEAEAYRLHSEALAVIDLYATEQEDDELHVWFEGGIERVFELGRRNPTPYMMVLPIVSDLRRGIVLWNERVVSSNQLAVGEYPPFTG